VDRPACPIYRLGKCLFPFGFPKARLASGPSGPTGPRCDGRLDMAASTLRPPPVSPIFSAAGEAEELVRPPPKSSGRSVVSPARRSFSLRQDGRHPSGLQRLPLCPFRDDLRENITDITDVTGGAAPAAIVLHMKGVLDTSGLRAAAMHLRLQRDRRWRDLFRREREGHHWRRFLRGSGRTGLSSRPLVCDAFGTLPLLREVHRPASVCCQRRRASEFAVPCRDRHDRHVR
jgi:hypothetical protein